MRKIEETKDMQSPFRAESVETKAIELAKKTAVAMGLRPTARATAEKQDIRGIASQVGEFGIQVDQLPSCDVWRVWLEHDVRHLQGPYQGDISKLGEEEREFATHFRGFETANRYFWVAENSYVCEWPMAPAEFGDAIKNTILHTA
jgi:hypothetical protein